MDASGPGDSRPQDQTLHAKALVETEQNLQEGKLGDSVP